MWINDRSKRVQPYEEAKVLKDIHCIRKASEYDYGCSIIISCSNLDSEFKISLKNVITVDPPVYNKLWKRSMVIDDFSYFYGE